MASYRTLRDIDWALLLLSLFICGLGVLQIYSATQGTKWHNAWWKQLIWVVLGLLLMWLVSSIDYHTLLGQVPLLYAGVLVLLLLTFVVGTKVFGARRWIALPGGVLLQVSEFGKIVIVLMVARFLTELKTEALHWRDLLKLIGLVGLPMTLVMKQPDLGTSLTYLPILATGVFLAGLRWQYALLLGIVALVLVPSSWFLLKDYQKSRIETFFDPSRDPKGEGYQIIQSKIAIGNGGMWGKGVSAGNSDQAAVPPRASYGFHLLGFRRGAWFCRCSSRPGVVFSVVDADRAERTDLAGSRGDVYLHGHLLLIAVSHAGERWHGSGPDARDGHSASLHEQRGIRHVERFYDVGAGA
jgi:rod shape determining protein RodA